LKVKGAYGAHGTKISVLGMFLFGAFWEAFTLVHMTLMAGGVWVSAKPATPFILLFYIPFHAVGLGLMGYPIYKTIGRWKVPEVELTVVGDRIVLGQTISVELRFVPRMRIDLNRITLKLEGKETAKEQIGTSTRTYHETFHQQTVVLAEGHTVEARQEELHKTSFPIPEDAMCSFETKNNKFEWTLALHLDIANGIDFSDTFVLNVLPELEERS